MVRSIMLLKIDNILPFYHLYLMTDTESEEYHYVSYCWLVVCATLRIDENNPQNVLSRSTAMSFTDELDARRHEEKMRKVGWTQTTTFRSPIIPNTIAGQVDAVPPKFT